MNAISSSLLSTSLIFIQKDNNHYYNLLEDVDYGSIFTKHFQAFDYKDDVLEVIAIDKNHSQWIIHAFSDQPDLWDGTSLLPDKSDNIPYINALFLASLFHDVVYAKVSQISNATGIPEKKLLAFADDVFAHLVNHYAPKQKILTRILHTILRFGGSIYHNIRKVLLILVIVNIVNLQGCYSLEDTQLDLEQVPNSQNYHYELIYK